MPRPAALVVYASTHGHTLKIAERIATRLRDGGLRVRLLEAGELENPEPGGADLVVVGGSVHAGHHQAAVLDWLHRHGAALEPRRTGVFSVSLTAADDGDESARTTAGYVDELIGQLRARPAEAQVFAGALQYREYDVATKVLMRLIAGRRDLPKDWHVDTVFTDWDAVDAFADRLAALVPEAVVGR